VDNGCGMSETDARMAFERHATSKIREANDLFNIRTMGFRGEALASIAAIAHVEIKTKLHDAEMGTQININGSQIEKQESIYCDNGTQFSIKNLFFNVPARRKFLKKESTEFKHIIDEIQRIAIVHTKVAFKLIHNNQEIYNLPVTHLKQRLQNIFGKTIAKELVPIFSDSPLIKISGIIGKPEYAKKILEAVTSHISDKEFFVGKAAGWILRELSKRDPELVRNYFTNNREKMTKLVIREGSKKL
jgi:DNA mismatch repair protein MutL